MRIKMFGKKDNKEKENGLFDRLRQSLAKTRAGFTERLDQLISRKNRIDEELLEELEEILFTSDLGVTASQELIRLVRDETAKKDLDNLETLKTALKQYTLGFLDVAEPQHSDPGPGKPLVVMVIGVNGVGKTTTIGKVADLYRNQNKKVMLVAADTFRAAAIDQLAIWGGRVGAEVVRQDQGADPSAVVFDALNAAMARKVDVVLIDTAGRLHTKVNLMEQLRKIQRVAGRRLPGAPHHVWLVLDATTGQNAISQAEMFHNALGVTGIILTKLDGTAKGGIVVGISRQLAIPIRFIGIGEKIDDLRSFKAEDFVEAIFTLCLTLLFYCLRISFFI
jgi:fused signal recognition particle receptor